MGCRAAAHSVQRALPMLGFCLCCVLFCCSTWGGTQGYIPSLFFGDRAACLSKLLVVLQGLSAFAAEPL